MSSLLPINTYAVFIQILLLPIISIITYYYIFETKQLADAIRLRSPLHLRGAEADGHQQARASKSQSPAPRSMRKGANFRKVAAERRFRAVNGEYGERQVIVPVFLAAVGVGLKCFADDATGPLHPVVGACVRHGAGGNNPSLPWSMWGNFVP